MFVLDVLIISTKARPPQPLSYRSQKAFSIGDIIEVTVRKTPHIALVIATHHPHDIKERLRNANFSLKKVESESKLASIPVNIMKYLLQEQPASLVTPAQYFGITISSKIVHALIQYKERIQKTGTLTQTKPTHYYYGNRTFQIESILNIIKENPEKSFCIICPDYHSAKRIENACTAQKIKHETLHSKRHVATQQRIISQALTGNLQNKHLIATPAFALLQYFTQQSVIIFKEELKSFNHLYYPNLNTLLPYKKYWKEQKQITAITKTVPTTVEAHKQVAQALQKTKTPTIVFFNKDIREKVSESSQELFHPFVAKTITEHLQKHLEARIFLFCTKGSIQYKIACKDCGAIKKCTNCNANIISTSNPAPHFWCSKNKAHAVKNPNHCDNCGGHQLFASSLSVQSVIDWTHQQFPNTQRISIPPNTKLTQKEESILQTRINNLTNGIVIGSQKMLLLANPKPNDACIATSLDNFAGATYANALNFAKQLVCTLTAFSPNTPLIIHTRLNQDHSFIKTIKQNNNEWIASQTSLAQQLQTPPFSSVITITYPNHVQFEETQAIQSAIDYIVQNNEQVTTTHNQQKTILQSSLSIEEFLNPHLQILLQDYERNGFKVEMLKKEI